MKERQWKKRFLTFFFHSKNLQVVLKEGNSSNSRPERFASDVSSACLWICLKQGWVGNTNSTFTTSISFFFMETEYHWKQWLLWETYNFKKTATQSKLIKKTATHSKLIKRIQHFVRKPRHRVHYKNKKTNN